MMNSIRQTTESCGYLRVKSVLAFHLSKGSPASDHMPGSLPGGSVSHHPPPPPLGVIFPGAALAACDNNF